MIERIIGKDGKCHWIRWEIAPWLHQDQSVGGLLLYLEGLTDFENKAAELDAALSAGNVGLWSRDLLENRITWSPETEKIWGFKPGEFDGRIETFDSLIHPDDLMDVKEGIQQSVLNKTRFQKEFRILWKDGSVHWIRGQGHCEYDATGKPLKLLGASVDVTALKTARSELHEERDRLHDLLEITREAEKIAQIGTWSLNLKTGETAWSEGVYRIFDLEPSNSPPCFNELCEKWFYPDDIPLIEEVLLHPQTRLEPWDIKHRIFRNDGRIRWVRAFGKVYPNEAGVIERWVGVVQDITDSEALCIENQALVQGLEMKVTERTRDLKLATEAKSRFLANMSHEIRNPLNSVTILANLLGQSGVKEEDRLKFVKRINTAIKTVTDILDEILDFSKMEAGQITLDEQPFRVNDILSDLRALFIEGAESKGITLEIIDGYLDFEVVGDAKRLRQILINLLSNAIKFTESGAITVTHQVQELENDSLLLSIDVIDTGIGIENGALATIFDPFTQADNGVTRKYGGTGLGLSITKTLIEMMNGEIEVKSTPGLGSRFSFFVRVKAKNEAGPLRSETVSSSERTLMSCHTLIVDDDETNLDSMKELLSSLGAVVLTANNGKAAVDYLRHPDNRCDLILMDIQMPVMDGITATRIIRGELHRDQVPILAVTGGLLPNQQKEALEAGMTALLRKPVETDVLIRQILSCCTDDCKRHCVATRQ